MSSSFHDFIRQRFPNDKRSDFELLTYFGGSPAAPQLFERFPDFADQYKEFRRSMRPSLGDEFKASVGSATDNLQATGYGAAALVADMLGADGAREWAAEGVKRNQEEAAEYQPSVGSYKDVESPGDALYYAVYGGGQVVPSAAETAAFALAGGGVGGLLGKSLVKGAAREVIKKGAAMGAQAGVAAASIPQAVGEIYNETGDAGLSIGAGTVAGALDLLPEAWIVSKFFGKPVARKAADEARGFAKRFIGATLKSLPVTIPSEGGTEALQELINIASAKYSRGEDPLDLNDQDIEQMTNAGIIGGIGGAGFAPIGAVGDARRGPAEKPAPVEQPASPSPQRPTPAPVAPQATAPEDTFAEPEPEPYAYPYDFPTNREAKIKKSTRNPVLAPTPEYDDSGLIDADLGVVRPERQAALDLPPTDAGINDFVSPDPEFDPFLTARPAYQSAQAMQSAITQREGEGHNAANAARLASQLSNEEITARQPSPSQETPVRESPPQGIRTEQGVSPQPRDQVEGAGAQPALADGRGSEQPQATSREDEIIQPAEIERPATVARYGEDPEATASTVRLFRAPLANGDPRKLIHAPAAGAGLTVQLKQFQSQLPKSKKDPSKFAAIIRDNETGAVHLRSLTKRTDKSRLMVEAAKQKGGEIDFLRPSTRAEATDIEAVTYTDGDGYEAPRYDLLGVAEFGKEAESGVAVNFASEEEFMATPGVSDRYASGAVAAPTSGAELSIKDGKVVAKKKRTGGRPNFTGDELTTELAEQGAAESAASTPSEISQIVQDAAMAHRTGDDIAPHREAIRNYIVGEAGRLNKVLSESDLDRFTSEMLDVAKSQATIRQPTSYRISPQRANGLLRASVGAVRQMGGSVTLYQQEVTKLLRAFTTTGVDGKPFVALGVNEFSAHDPMLAVQALHEASHVFLNGLPPDIQNVFHDAIGRMPSSEQRWLMNPLSTDVRLLANSSRENLTPEQQSLLDAIAPEDVERYRRMDPTELIIEQAAEHLAMLGIEKGRSRPLLQRIIDFFKRAMAQVGISLSRSFGVTPNPAIIKRFVEGRWLRTINEQFAQLNGSEHFPTAIGAKPKLETRVAFYDSPRGTKTSAMEVDLVTGRQFTPEFVPTNVSAMADFVDAIFRNADVAEERRVQFTERMAPAHVATGSLDPKLSLEGELAAVNLIEETLVATYQDSETRRYTPEIDLETFLKKWVGVTPSESPTVLRDALAKRASTHGIDPAVLNSRIAINDLPAADNGGVGSLQATALRSAAVKLSKVRKRLLDKLSAARATRHKLQERQKDRDLTKKSAKQLDDLNSLVPALERIHTQIADETERLTEKMGGGSYDPLLILPNGEYRVPGSRDAKPSAWHTRKVPISLKYSPAKMEERIADMGVLSEWLRNEDNKKYGAAYTAAAETLKQLGVLQVNELAYDHRNFQFLTVQSDGPSAQVKAIGTPTAKLLSSLFSQFENLKTRWFNPISQMGDKWARARQDLKVAMGFKNLDDRHFRRSIVEPALYLMHRSPDGTVNPFQRIAEKLTTNYGIDLSSQERRSALRTFYEVTVESDEMVAGIFKEAGLKVKDSELGIERDLIRRGIFTGTRSFSQTLEAVHSAMAPEWLAAMAESNSGHTDSVTGEPIPHSRAAGWLASMASSQDADAQLEPLFTPNVIRDFVEPLVTAEEARFRVSDQAGLREVAPEDVAAAWDSAREGSGSILLRFADAMHVQLRATGKIEDTRSAVLATFGKAFDEVNSVISEHTAARDKIGQTMLPRQMMDAVKADNWPSAWVEFGAYDKGAMHLRLNHMALNAAFGRDLNKLEIYLSKMRSEQKAIKTEYDEITGIEGVADPKVVKERMGEARYAMAKKDGDIRNLLHEVPIFVHALSRSTQANQGDFRLPVQVIRLLSKMVLQAPKSAIVNLFDAQAFLLRYKLGPTGTKAFGRTMAQFIKRGGGALGLATANDMMLSRAEAGIYGQSSYQKLHDRMAEQGTGGFLAKDDPLETTSRKVSRNLQLTTLKADALTDITFEDLRAWMGGKKSETDTSRSKFRLFGIFSNFTEWMELAVGDAYTLGFTDLATKVFDNLNSVKSNLSPQAFEELLADYASGARKFDPEELGYDSSSPLRNDAEAWAKFREDVALKMREGTLERMMVDAYRRTNGEAGSSKIWTPQQLASMQTIANTEISLKANSLNMPIAGLTNPYVKSLSTFLTWPYLASMRTLNAMRDPTQEFNGQSMANFMTVMLLGALPATMAGTLLVDLYDEWVMGKKSNLQSVDAIAALPGVGLYSAAKDWRAVMERFSRYGPAGFIGDAANSLVNFDDARNGALSLDGRIFVINYARGFIDTMNRFYNQDFQATYSSIYRPMLNIAGMRAPLEYLQITNNAFGLNNAEAQTNERINIGNYLRSEGRTQKLNVRKAGQVYGQPTAVTPWLQQMEMAALTGDAEQFRTAYRHAIERARELGKPDPAKYILGAFQSRHPLRKTFQTAPTESEYRELLAGLSQNGRSAVSSGVRSFNTYLQRLGSKPYYGRKAGEKSYVPDYGSLYQSHAIAAQAAYGDYDY